MNQQQAETAISGAALVVGGIYIFRRLSETDVQLTGAHGLRLKQLAGAGPVLPVGPFVVGWGFTFLVLALLAQASPKLGGSFAVLVGAGAVLGNGMAIGRDLNTGLAVKGDAGNLPASIPPLQPVPAGVPLPTIRPQGAGLPPLYPVPQNLLPPLTKVR